MDYFETKRMLEIYGLNSGIPEQMSNFQVVPPGLIRPNIGLSKASRLKEKIIGDNATMLSKLYDYHKVFQHQAKSLFDMSTSAQFMPSHPLRSRVNSTMLLQSEIDKLRQENMELKQQLQKFQNKKN